MKTTKKTTATRTGKTRERSGMPEPEKNTNEDYWKKESDFDSSGKKDNSDNKPSGEQNRKKENSINNNTDLKSDYETGFATDKEANRVMPYDTINPGDKTSKYNSEFNQSGNNSDKTSPDPGGDKTSTEKNGNT